MHCLFLVFGMICSSAPPLTAQAAADLLRPGAWKPTLVSTEGPRVTIIPDTSLRTTMTPDSASCCDLYINGVPLRHGDLTPYQRLRVEGR